MKTRAFDPETKQWRTDYVVTSEGIVCSMKVGKHFTLEKPIYLTPQLDWKLSRFYENRMNPENEIWEHDIVSCNILGSGVHRGTVVYIDGCFDVLFPYPIKFLDGIVRDRYYVKCFTVNHAIKVIGDVFLNPELLEV